MEGVTGERDGRLAAQREGSGRSQTGGAEWREGGGRGKPCSAARRFLAVVNGTALLCGLGLTLSGFAMVRDIDGQNYKHVRSNNRAALNDSALTGSTLSPRMAWGERIRREVPGVVYAAVLQRGRNVFVAAAPAVGDRVSGGPTAAHAAGRPGASSGAPAVDLPASVERFVRRLDPRVEHVYVTSDPTVVNHFHRYVADRMAGQHTGGDVVFNDLERLYPNVRW